MSGGDGRQGGEIGGDGQAQRHVEQHVLRDPARRWPMVADPLPIAV
jgi:hypothetical protein